LKRVVTNCPQSLALPAISLPGPGSEKHPPSWGYPRPGGPQDLSPRRKPGTSISAPIPQFNSSAPPGAAWHRTPAIDLHGSPWPATICRIRRGSTRSASSFSIPGSPAFFLSAFFRSLARLAGSSGGRGGYPAGRSYRSVFLRRCGRTGSLCRSPRFS